MGVEGNILPLLSKTALRLLLEELIKKTLVKSIVWLAN